MKVNVKTLDDESYNLEVELDVGVGLGDVEPESMADRDLQLLAPKISPSQLKVNEAQYFLRMVRRFLTNEAATQYHFNGFVTALSSIIDVLTNEGPKQDSRFTPWMRGKRNALTTHPDFSRFVDLRNQTVHQSMHPPTLAFGFALREHLDGSRTVEPLLEMVALDGRETPDPIAAMERALAAARAVVDEATAEGFIARKPKPGHSGLLRFQRETEPNRWEDADPRKMEMFGGRMPTIGFGQRTIQFDGNRNGEPSNSAG